MSSESGIMELLTYLKEEEIFALAKTVTQNLLKIGNREEAIVGILKYSPDEVNILRRKVLTREILFSYLDAKNISVKLPATKNDLIDAIIEFWKKENSLKLLPNSQSTIVQNENAAEGDIEKLAQEFAKWFYRQMNIEIVESTHFFSDAKLKISVFSNSDCDTSVIENDPQEISHSLHRIKLQYDLYFNPNFTEDGVQGRIDSHGLVIVLVCGTLHTHNSIAGIFEQVFGLARDPFSDNNWKIKHSELILKSKSDILNQPKLCDSELTSNLLLLPNK